MPGSAHRTVHLELSERSGCLTRSTPRQRRPYLRRKEQFRSKSTLPISMLFAVLPLRRDTEPWDPYFPRRKHAGRLRFLACRRARNCLGLRRLHLCRKEHRASSLPATDYEWARNCWREAAYASSAGGRLRWSAVPPRSAHRRGRPSRRTCPPAQKTGLEVEPGTKRSDILIRTLRDPQNSSKRKLAAIWRF